VIKTMGFIDIESSPADPDRLLNFIRKPSA